jgi:hypothetical protein
MVRILLDLVLLLLLIHDGGYHSLKSYVALYWILGNMNTGQILFWSA